MNERRATGLSPADEAAIRWQARLQSGSMSVEERLEFETWLAAAPENWEAYSRLDRTLGGLDETGTQSLALEYERELSALSARPAFSRRWLPAAAAAAIAAIALPTLLFVAKPEAPEVYATRVGERRTVELADGSRVTLSTNTRIAVSLAGDRRNVELAGGEALFDVAPDHARPFSVKTPHANVVVTGTIFDVRAADASSSVYVISGAVDVRSRDADGATLLAGDSVGVSDAGVAPVERYDPNVVLAWRRGRLKFDETPLADALEELNRYFEKPIALDDPSLASLPLSGEIATNDQSAAVRSIATAFSLRAETQSDRIVLAKAAE